MWKNEWSFSEWISLLLELDALGDELEFDQDSAYLDDAINAPAAPDTVPAEKDTSGSRTKVCGPIIAFCSNNFQPMSIIP